MGGAALCCRDLCHSLLGACSYRPDCYRAVVVAQLCGVGFYLGFHTSCIKKVNRRAVLRPVPPAARTRVSRLCLVQGVAAPHRGM